MLSETESRAWHATLDLAFDTRRNGTVLAKNLHRGPLQVQKTLYPEGPQTCHVAVLHPPGGIAAQDRLAIRASLAPQARALLTTPGATKWYRSEGERARQEVHFELRENCVLEWLPRENIYFDGARIESRLEISLGAGAIFFGWDIVSFGRRAAGERWRRGSLDWSTTLRRGAQVLWSELARVDAGDRFAESAVALAGLPVCGTFLVAGASIDAELLAACRAVSARGDGARVGVTCVPEVLIARYLGHSTEAAFAWFVALWEVLRPALTQRVACAPRVWAC
jgi:urease accessory protein